MKAEEGAQEAYRSPRRQAKKAPKKLMEAQEGRPRSESKPKKASQKVYIRPRRNPRSQRKSKKQPKKLTQAQEPANGSPRRQAMKST